MKLFFETGDQAAFFLLMIPCGFLMALCIHTGPASGLLRFALDLMVMLAGAACTVGLLFSGKDEVLRVYHMLGILTGSLLYLSGASRCIQWVKTKIRYSGRKHRSNEE